MYLCGVQEGQTGAVKTTRIKGNIAREDAFTNENCAQRAGKGAGYLADNVGCLNAPEVYEDSRCLVDTPIGFQRGDIDQHVAAIRAKLGAGEATTVVSVDQLAGRGACL